MEFTIRDATKKDAKAISRVFAASWRDTYRGQIDQDYLDHLGDDHWTRFLREGVAAKKLIVPVVWDGERIVGAAVSRASAIQRFPEDGELACLYLLPGWLGRGAGKALLEHSEAALRRNGFAHCALDVLTTNRHAKEFYLRNGYEVTPHRVQFSLGREDLECLLMRKAL